MDMSVKSINMWYPSPTNARIHSTKSLTPFNKSRNRIGQRIIANTTASRIWYGVTMWTRRVIKDRVVIDMKPVWRWKVRHQRQNSGHCLILLLLFCWSWMICDLLLFSALKSMTLNRLWSMPCDVTVPQYAERSKERSGGQERKERNHVEPREAIERQSIGQKHRRSADTGRSNEESTVGAY